MVEYASLFPSRGESCNKMHFVKKMQHKMNERLMKTIYVKHINYIDVSDDDIFVAVAQAEKQELS